LKGRGFSRAAHRFQSFTHGWEAVPFEDFDAQSFSPNHYQLSENNSGEEAALPRRNGY